MDQTPYGEDTPAADPDRAPVLMSRRFVLASATAAAGAFALASCGGSSGGSAAASTSAAGETSKAAASENATSAAATSAAATSTGAGESATESEKPGAASSSAAGHGHLKVSDVPIGAAVVVSSGGKPFVVTQPEQGKYVAFSAICPHAGCTVQPEGGILVCPCHGSKFSLQDGKRISGLARSGLPSVKVKVENGEVLRG